MNIALLVISVIVAVVAIDAAAVAYGVHIGMKYPFIAAAIANMGIIVLTHLTGIIWMLTRT